MNKKLYIKTWGCQMNEYDSAKIIDLLYDTDKYELTNIAENADLIVLNTCSIREKAQEKLFHQLGRFKKIKERKSNVILAVGGCVASQEGKNILQRSKNVDIVFGPQTLHRLPELINETKKTSYPVIDISFPEIEKFDHFPYPKSKGYFAYVSIMEGCNKFCSFCIVPYTRGMEISRPCDDILYEIVKLSEQGVKEICLLGQNVNAYKGKTHDHDVCSFSELLRLVASIDGIERIRFLTSHPMEFTDDIINVYKDTPKLANSLHLPVQSGSDKILSFMKRSYDIKHYKKIIDKLRNIRSDILITSDFIVGFPGETKKDFQNTIQFIDEIKFDMSFSFIYSPRPGTPAATLINDINDNEKKQRLYLLQKHINNNAIHYSRLMLGSIQRVLVNGVSKKNIMNFFGLTDANRIVNFEGDKDMIGNFVNVKITNVYGNSLFGTVIKNN